MESLQRLLREHPFCAAMGDEQVAFMVGCATNRRFQVGDFLIREATPARSLFLIRRGRVSVEIDVPGRPPTSIETIEAGDVLGGSFLFPPHVWGADARATEAVVALEFDGTCLRAKMNADPALGFAVTLGLLQRLHERLDRVRLQRLDLYR